MITSFRNDLGQNLSLFLSLENAFHRGLILKSTKRGKIQNSPPFYRLACFYKPIRGKVCTFSILGNESSVKRKPSSKIWSTIWKGNISLQKLLCQKAMSKQIEWGVQNRPITKNDVLPVTTLFFENLC